MNNQIAYYEQKLQFEIDAWDLRRALDEGEKIVIVDTRSEESYNEEHIAEAISLHHRKITQESTANLSKDVLYVTYCTGIGCNASTKGALKLVKLGFKVKELIGGLEWWKKDGYKTLGTNVKEDKKCSCGCS